MFQAQSGGIDGAPQADESTALPALGTILDAVEFATPTSPGRRLSIGHRKCDSSFFNLGKLAFAKSHERISLSMCPAGMECAILPIADHHHRDQTERALIRSGGGPHLADAKDRYQLQLQRKRAMNNSFGPESDAGATPAKTWGTLQGGMRISMRSAQIEACQAARHAT